MIIHTGTTLLQKDFVFKLFVIFFCPRIPTFILKHFYCNSNQANQSKLQYLR